VVFPDSEETAHRHWHYLAAIRARLLNFTADAKDHSGRNFVNFFLSHIDFFIVVSLFMITSNFEKLS